MFVVFLIMAPFSQEVELPQNPERFTLDFLATTDFFDGSGLFILPLHAIASQPAINVLSETKRLRVRIGLPNNLLRLGDPAKSLVLDCGRRKSYLVRCN